MLDPTEKAAWQLRGATPRLNGYPWMRKAIRLGGVDMDYALSLVTEFRLADLKPARSGHGVEALARLRYTRLQSRSYGRERNAAEAACTGLHVPVLSPGR